MRDKILKALQSGPKTPIELYDLCKCDPYEFARMLTELSDRDKIERRVTIPNHDQVYRSVTLIPNMLLENLPWQAVRVEYHLTTKTQ